MKLADARQRHDERTPREVPIVHWADPAPDAPGFRSVLAVCGNLAGFAATHAYDTTCPECLARLRERSGK